MKKNVKGLLIAYMEDFVKSKFAVGYQMHCVGFICYSSFRLESLDTIQ